MSRSVYLVCEECRAPHDRDASDRINHGEEALRELWATRDAVRALAASAAWDVNSIEPNYGGRGDWFRWIAAHATHRVSLHDEYGGVAPVDGTGNCERPA